MNKLRDSQGNEIELSKTVNGFAYKNSTAFYSKSTDVCYIPEVEDEVITDKTTSYRYADFLNLANGNEELAEELFRGIDWQYPETYLDELGL